MLETRMACEKPVVAEQDATACVSAVSPSPGDLLKEEFGVRESLQPVSQSSMALVTYDPSASRDGISSKSAKETNQTATQRPSKVRFAIPLTTVMGTAVADYDRRSIAVDLSKTPFALFHKDALLMAKATSAVPAVGKRKELHEASSADVDAMSQTKMAQIPSVHNSSQFRSSYFGSWESEESDCSGITDSETDFDHSDTDSLGAFDCGGEEPAFYGVWKRTTSEGYEALLRSSGVPKRAIGAALRKHPVHLIDHDGTYFRLIVKNGLSKVDNTFFIGDPPKTERVGNKSYDMSLNWADLSGNGNQHDLSLSSVCHETGEEVIAIRSLEDGGNGMTLTQIVRRPADNKEFRAKHFFKRVTCREELRSGPGPSACTTVKVHRKGVSTPSRS